MTLFSCSVCGQVTTRSSGICSVCVNPPPIVGRRILVCGGRDYQDREALFAVLDALHAADPVGLIVEGGAAGADSLARLWTQERKITLHSYRADWKHYGRQAGPMRNQAMLSSEPDLVVAFPGGRGTANMVRTAWRAGVEVMEIDA